MKWILQRETPAIEGTFGTLSDEAGTRLCDTLEPSASAPDGYANAAITARTYPAVLRFSSHRGYAVPGLVGVPNEPNVELHTGNTIADTKDCILPGTARGQAQGSDDVTRYGVLNSRVAFERLMGLLEVPGYRALTSWDHVRQFLLDHDEAGRVTLEIRDP